MVSFIMVNAIGWSHPELKTCHTGSPGVTIYWLNVCMCACVHVCMCACACVWSPIQGDCQTKTISQLCFLEENVSNALKDMLQLVSQ